MSSFGSHIKIDRYRRSHLKLCNFSTTIITQDTEIKIWFDGSGSMPDTNNDLQTMRDQNLKETLLPFYNGDETLYNEKVTTNNFGGEDTFARLAAEPSVLEDGVINMVFQDEAQAGYHGSLSSFNSGTRTTSYDNDMSTLRDNLINTFPEGKYQGIVFQVSGNSGFKSFLQAVENGGGAYDPPNGLSDRDEVTFRYDIARNNGAQYYADLIESEIL